jgi:FO synthase
LKRGHGRHWNWHFTRGGLPLHACQRGGLAGLFEDAGRIRARPTRPVINHSRKVFIPLTNLCRAHCGYGTFARVPGDPLAHTMSPEEVLAVARAGRQARRKEALFSLGE